MKPNWARAWLLLRGLNVLVTLSVCGPGYTYSTTGYFLFGSKSNGLYITPYKSVTPSSALTLNGSGNLKPASLSALMSGESSFVTTPPSVSYSAADGAASIRDALSTKYRLESARLTAWLASPGSSSLMLAPS